MTDDAKWRAKVTFETPEPLTDDQREELVLKFDEPLDTFVLMLDNEEIHVVEIEFDVNEEDYGKAIGVASSIFSIAAHQVLDRFFNVKIDAEKWSDILAREAEEDERMSENGTDV